MIDYLGLHRNKILFVLTIVGLVQMLSFSAVDILEQRATQHLYSGAAEAMNSRVKQAIEEKQKATVAIAIVLSATLKKPAVDFEIFDQSPEMKRIKDFSNYKNLWVQIVSPEGVSLYRNWSPVREGLAKIRPEFAEITRTGRPVTSISSGRFDLSIKAVVPIIDGDKVTGFVDLISHFNSIQKAFEKSHIPSLVVATQARTKLIKRPFSQHTLGQHYVSNLEPDMTLFQRVTPELYQQWVGQKYAVWQEYLVVPFPLVANNGATHGHFFSFVPLETVKPLDTDFVAADQAKYWIIQLNVLFSILLIVSLGVYLIYAQKQHYKNILNTENDLVLVTNGLKITEGNNKIFEYFPSLKTNETDCVCDSFIEEEGYLQKYMGGQTWLEVLLADSEKVHLAKIIKEDKEVVLTAKASVLDEKRHLSVVVFSDVTQLQEFYSQSRTDPLTRAGNRRSFDFQLKQAISDAETNQTALGLLIFDIDDFKSVNDQFGHVAGDNVLKTVSDRCFEVLEHHQILYRVGGEEFAVILAEEKQEDVAKIAEVIRATIEVSHMTPKVTVSIGGSMLHASDKLEWFYSRADKALYQAKQKGKNQVVMT